MLKLKSTFYLTGSSENLYLRSGRGQPLPKRKKIILVGLSISMETTGKKIYEVCSDGYAVSDNPVSFRGTIWPRSLLPLGPEISVEQQMLLPAAGGAVAASWRLLGRTPASSAQS